MPAKRFRLHLRRTARDNDAGVRVIAPRLADCLARLTHGLGGYGAGVDDDGVVETGRARMLRHRLAFHKH